MKRISNALKTLGEVGHALNVRSQKVDRMTTELIRRGYGIDLTQARKIAAILVDQAEVTWK
jgi:hypothetical protein